VYEFGQKNHTQFVVMEYLDGENLQQIIRKNSPLSLYQNLRIIDQLADVCIAPIAVA
jgi:serine/threonine protein kinase